MDASTIGQYRIVETLGQGGMGIVFRARHLASERAVALKTVRLPAPRWLDSIRREIQALTRVRHPGVVRIVDHGVHEGRPWYAMDLLEGETLRQFGRRIWSPYYPYPSVSTPVSQTDELSAASDLTTLDDVVAPSGVRSTQRAWAGGPRAVLDGKSVAAAGELMPILKVMRRVCASLAFMHGEGFINRDLKPENIVLVDGLPVIIDFGLTAHHPGNSGREELEGQQGVAGTVHYMSPEQIRGELVDARGDLYAIGCILYELVVGRPPFSGAPRAVMLQHLNAMPVPPSQHVSDVPPALEQLIMKLLEKESGKRIGYADEVAAELAELSLDKPRLPDYPPARSYLYRPGFVGREELVSELLTIRDRAALGQGAMILLGGESGAGKTRVAMELTRTRKHAMRVITSETAQLVAENEVPVASSPLHALRPLLRAIADECHAGGSQVTERLLDDHRQILSLYEPLLLDVPDDRPSEPPAALAPDAARRRVFRALTDTLRRFAHERPLLFVIDDLGWVDEVSLAFLSSLDGAFFAETPLFLLCTYRSEDTPAAVRALGALPHVGTRQLPRLGEGPVRAMVSDMLALAEPEDDFVEFVTREAEGNPFFVAEYLRAAVSERILYRDQLRTWQVRGRARGTRDAPLSLALPRSLRALIDQRLRSLSTAAQQVSLAAAVLGREMEFAVLSEVSGLPDQTSVSAVDELLRRQVLEQTDAGRLRFMHDKLREETYRHAPAGAVRALHARAGSTLEAQLPEGSAGASSWAMLGHHFAQAEQRASAVHYLELAAQHAQASSAHGDALSLYGQALDHATRLEHADATAWTARVTRLHEEHGNLLALLSQRDEARVAYYAAYQRAAEQPMVLSRLHRRLGKLWEGQHVHDEALKHYQAAQGLLSPTSDALTQAERDEWVQVRLDQLWVYYWQGDVERMADLNRALEPIIDSASPSQRAGYFGARMRFDMRRSRYRISVQALTDGRANVAACRSGDLPDLPNALFELGFVMCLAGELEEAEEVLGESLRRYKKVGDAAQQTRCLCYLTLCARLRGAVSETRELALESERVAGASGMREYVAAALANQAWGSLSRGERAVAAAQARAALTIWRDFELFPFEWMALAPLLRVSLLEHDVPAAISYAHALVAPRQRPLPGSCPDELARAIEQYDHGLLQQAADTLERMLEELPEGYC